MIYEKPYYNGADYVVEVKNNAGLTVERHKFATEKEASDFIRQYTEQPKTKAALGGSENK